MFGQMGNDNGNFKFPKDVAISNDGYLFVTDTQGHRVQKFSTPLVEKSEIIEEKQTLQTETEPQTENVEVAKSPLQPVNPIPNDFQKPTILVPEDILIEASGPLTSINIGEAMATDESGIYSLSNNAPSSFPLGINTIIWTAVDGVGNMAIASQTVTIQDSTSPKISSIDDISLEARSSTQNLVTLAVPDVTDEVGVMSITNDAPEVFPLGETIVTWTATDKFGNTSSSLQTISVQTCGNDPLSYNLIVGSEEDDILIGTALSDLIFANGGDDIISGDKGNDCILAGDGDDIIFGNQGNDNISGQGGNDIIKGQSGDDFVFGGLGLDVIDGGDDIDICKVIDEQSYDIVIKCESNE